VGAVKLESLGRRVAQSDPALVPNELEHSLVRARVLREASRRPRRAPLFNHATAGLFVFIALLASTIAAFEWREAAGAPVPRAAEVGPTPVHFYWSAVSPKPPSRHRNP
jgi:hypothetical protein